MWITEKLWLMNRSLDMFCDWIYNIEVTRSFVGLHLHCGSLVNITWEIIISIDSYVKWLMNMLIGNWRVAHRLLYWYSVGKKGESFIEETSALHTLYASFYKQRSDIRHTNKQVRYTQYIHCIIIFGGREASKLRTEFVAKTGSDPLTISVCAVFLKARIKFLAGGADSLNCILCSTC